MPRKATPKDSEAMSDVEVEAAVVKRLELRVKRQRRDARAPTPDATPRARGMEREPAREAAARGAAASLPQTEAGPPAQAHDAADAMASGEALTARFAVFATAARVLATRRRGAAVPWQEIRQAVEHETRQPFSTRLLGVFLTLVPGVCYSVRCGEAAHDLSLVVAQDAVDPVISFRKRLAAFMASAHNAADERAALAQIPVTAPPLPKFTLVFDEASGRLVSRAQSERAEDKTFGAGLALARMSERKTWKRDLKRPRPTLQPNIKGKAHPSLLKDTGAQQQQQQQHSQDRRSQGVLRPIPNGSNVLFQAEPPPKRLRGLKGLPETLIEQVRERARIEHEMSASEVQRRQRRQARTSLPSFFDLVYLHFRTARRQSWDVDDLIKSILHKRGANTYGPAIKNAASKVAIIREQLALLLEILPEWCFLTDSQVFPGQKIFNVRKGKPAQLASWRRLTHASAVPSLGM